MTVNVASTIFSFASWLIYVQIGCRHPFFRHWQPLLRKTTATCFLLHPEKERQLRVNDFWLHILADLRSDWLQISIYQYWQPLFAETTAKSSLLHPENERQWNINSFSCCIFGNQVIVLIFAFITELLTAIIGKYTIYQR